MALMDANELCHLAADLAAEHGPFAIDYAQRAVAAFRQSGETEREEFWHTMTVLLDDIFMQRLDPSARIVLH